MPSARERVGRRARAETKAGERAVENRFALRGD